MKRTAVLAGTGLLAAAALRRRMELPEVPPSLAGAEERHVAVGDGMLVATYERGPANDRPVLLVHSVNAAASAAEMRPLFDRLAVDRRTVAMDLPGYGRSSRPRATYTPSAMVDGILAVIDDIDAATDVVALSLGCELAAQAAIERPDRVRSLVLISPTGLQTAQGRSFSVPSLGAVIRAPVVGDALFGALASRRSIAYFLGKSFAGDVDVDLMEHAHVTARHPNARFAPASFLAGALFTPNAVRALYEQLTMPVLVIADQDPYTDFGALPALIARTPNWKHRTLAPHLGLPHFEHPEAVAETVQAFQAGRPLPGAPPS